MFVDECLVICENETRKEFLNVNANKALVSHELTDEVFKNMCITTVSHLLSFIRPILINLLHSQHLENFKINPCP